MVGGNARMLDTGDVAPHWWARWSPDSQIIFAPDPEAAQFAYPYNVVMVMSADGTDPTVLLPRSPFKRDFVSFESG